MIGQICTNELSVFFCAAFLIFFFYPRRLFLQRALRPQVDYYAIEKMWSKLKQYLRTVKARTQEALLQAVSRALQSICIKDAQGGFLRISAIVTARFRIIVTDKVRQTKVCGLYINRSR